MLNANMNSGRGLSGLFGSSGCVSGPDIQTNQTNEMNETNQTNQRNQIDQKNSPVPQDICGSVGGVPSDSY